MGENHASTAKNAEVLKTATQHYVPRKLRVILNTHTHHSALRSMADRSHCLTIS